MIIHIYDNYEDTEVRNDYRPTNGLRARKLSLHKSPELADRRAKPCAAALSERSCERRGEKGTGLGDGLDIFGSLREQGL
jgi:hypothetical protein